MHNFYDLKPQISDPKYGAEPSIRELLMQYYTTHDIPHDKAKDLVEMYISDLEKLRRKPLELFISGPNGYALVVPISNIENWEKRYGEEAVIKGLCYLTGDDESDYTVTRLTNKE